ncbi:MAG: hypothetical protein P4L40_13915 [Terracidiphilus sp.]|nr:hypothetical protein [Terracidiphilus sp.]
MKVTIHGTNYTAALDAERPLTIERKLNEPSVCQLWLSLPVDGSLAIPTRNQSIVISGDDGTTYFTGYLAMSPLPEYAGMGMTGPRYRLAIQAVSDELLLDQAALATGVRMASASAGAAVTAMVTRTGLTALSTKGLSLSTAVGTFAVDAGTKWSRAAGNLANQARAVYRASNGAVSLSSIPASVHILNETDGSLELQSLSLTAAMHRTLANDATVFGEHEPTAYVTEYFLGDGVTTEFALAKSPFFQPASQSTVIDEQFDESAINQSIWIESDGYMTLGADGLTMNGGSGYDGETILATLSKVEMGGTLLLEATGVTLANGSSGVLAGFFGGDKTQASCTAGFVATAASGTGAVTLQPLIEGTPSGATYTINPANQYALRIRVHCCEMEREQPLYRSWGDSGQLTAGGAINALPASLLFEIQEFVDGVAGMPVVLYDGAVSSLPDACWVAAVSSLYMVGSIRSLRLTNLGTGWVRTAPSGGALSTRRLGTTAQGGECSVGRTGKLVFYPGFEPPAGAQIQVSYRATGRAAGRAVNAASQAALGAAGLPAVCSWAGSVTEPAARSSQDCRNAALVIAQAAASASAAWMGAYKSMRSNFASDVWPGDALQLNASSAGLSAQVVVRAVNLSYAASCPDVVRYMIRFANEWADDLAIKTSSTIPADAQLPVTASPSYAANLSGLAVTSINGSAVTVNVGVSAPSGGGFEVRRRDGGFRPGEDTDLVMRAVTPTMTFTRETASERFYVRMYDGATPPNYSEFSAALIFNLPLAS